MQTTFDHKFRANVKKLNIFLNEQDATDALKCFSDRIFWIRQRAKHFRILVQSLQDRFETQNSRTATGAPACPIVSTAHLSVQERMYYLVAREV